MRTTLAIILLVNLTIFLKGQSINIDSCGVDDKNVLNKWEIEYFKYSIKQLKSIDLENKVFAFAYGNFGDTVISKKHYFKKWGRDYYTRNSGVYNILIKLTEEEKQLSGGFDYTILSWSKTLPAGKSRRKLIESIKKHSEVNLNSDK
jgi:hypothetical protein